MLFVCPTPIGNLGDITSRVLETLAAVDLIAAEDTRHTGRLLAHFGIDKPQLSYFEHNELKRVPEIIAKLKEGSDIALVSDAGMPGICDPGYRLVAAALAEGIPVGVLPGPSALETALVASGFPTDSFVFLGFTPRRKAERKRMLKEIGTEKRTCIAFESPHRLASTLAAAAEVLGDRRIAVCRELTKRFETVSRGTAAELAASLPEKVRGEIVLVFAPSEETGADAYDSRLDDALRELLAAGLPARRAAAIASGLAGLSRNKAYQRALNLKEEPGA